MKFDLFKMLYSEALEAETLELFIAERGWQDWMNEYETESHKIADVLTRIYQLANNPVSKTRNISRAEFSRTYNIPNRTLEDWDWGNRKPPQYVKLLIDFAQFNN